MIRKYNFMIFSTIFVILMALAFFAGYNREDANTEVGKSNTEPAFTETIHAASESSGDCSSCSCANK